MKNRSPLHLAALLSFCIVSAMQAQLPSPTAQTVPTTPKKNVIQVSRPPASARPSPLNRLSTAQRAALVNDKPPIKQLPGFTTADRNGLPVAAESLPRTSHWLLLYRSASCLACDRLLTVLAASSTAAPRNGQPYVIVVGGNRPNGLEIERAKYATLGDATWLADKDGQALAALKPRGAPTLYGMDGANVAWTVPGNLGDPARVATLASAWLAQPHTPAANSTAVAPTAPGGAK
jgi:hypothetical protein